MLSVSNKFKQISTKTASAENIRDNRAYGNWVKMDAQIKGER